MWQQLLCSEFYKNPSEKINNNSGNTKTNHHGFQFIENQIKWSEKHPSLFVESKGQDNTFIFICKFRENSISL